MILVGPPVRYGGAVVAESPPTAGPVLRIKPTGRFGNQMLQYMLAQRIASHVPDLLICGEEMPEWGLSTPVPADFPERSHLVVGPNHSFGQLARHLRRGTLRAATLGGVSWRLEDLRSQAEDRALFTPVDLAPVEVYGEEYIVIHIRGGDILSDTHSDYGPIPLSFMSQVIRETGARPVLLGQLAENRYTDAIIGRFPDAVVRPAGDLIADFETIRNARHIAIAVSTFSWMAAWLSDASTVHVPVSGLLNPAQRPDINLLPIDDVRYRFYGFDLRRWTASEQDYEYLLDDRQHPVLERSELRSILRAARSTVAVSKLRRYVETEARLQVRRVRNRRPA